MAVVTTAAGNVAKISSKFRSERIYCVTTKAIRNPKIGIEFFNCNKSALMSSFCTNIIDELEIRMHHIGSTRDNDVQCFSINAADVLAVVRAFNDQQGFEFVARARPPPNLFQKRQPIDVDTDDWPTSMLRINVAYVSAEALSQARTSDLEHCLIVTDGNSFKLGNLVEWLSVTPQSTSLPTVRANEFVAVVVVSNFEFTLACRTVERATKVDWVPMDELCETTRKLIDEQFPKCFTNARTMFWCL